MRFKSTKQFVNFLFENTEPSQALPAEYTQIPNPLPTNTYFMKATTKNGDGKYSYDFEGDFEGSSYSGNNTIEDLDSETVINQAKSDFSNEFGMEYPIHVYFKDDSYDPQEEYESSKNNNYELINQK